MTADYKLSLLGFIPFFVIGNDTSSNTATLNYSRPNSAETDKVTYNCGELKQKTVSRYFWTLFTA